MTAKRPTKLMAETPSMSWADHVEESRNSKIAVAIAAVAVLSFGAGFLLAFAIFA